MKISMRKVIVKETMKEEVISEWVQPKDFDLKCVCLTVPAFKLSLNIAYGSYAEFKKFLKKEFDIDTEHKDCNAMAVTFDKDGTAWHWMNIQVNDWRAEEYGTICHELHHVTHFMYEKMGVTYGSAGEEAYAYLQGHLMELVVRAFVMLDKKLRPEKFKKKKKK